MYNCAKEILGYHGDEVSLPQPERTSMRERRDSNRNRITKGLETNEKPSPLEFYKQGSYAMKTMVQHPHNDYDIDDGVYFDREDLRSSDGSDMTPLAARDMIRDAADDGSFTTPPAALRNCVRIHYAVGYHVDVPVYRRVVDENGDSFYELAASDEWKRSDARDVSAWFDKENQAQSPDDSNGRQLRRTTRLIKKFAQSRPAWKGQIGDGFMITKLVTEDYSADIDREDQALYYSMEGIRDRLKARLVVDHPVTPESTITDGDADPKATFLKEKLSEAIDDLQVLFESDCTDEQASEAWDKVFATTYFSNDLKKKEQSRKNLPPDEDDKVGLLRKAAAAVQNPSKPWSRGL